MANFHLVMRSGPTIGRTYPLEGGELTIGRDTTNKIAINDVEISRKHARIRFQGADVVLDDLGSTNGTFINGQKIGGSVTIKVGDEIALGENVVLFCEADFDPDATVMASKPKAAKPVAAAAAPAPVPAPAPEPVPAPAAVEPVVSYSGQVPESPAVPKKKKNTKILLIIIAVLALLCICGVGLFLYFAPTSFWCSLPVITWPQGACQ